MTEEVKLDHEEWEIILAARKIFGEQQKEKPWIRHQQLEPIIKLHLAEPQRHGEDPAYCICGVEIPAIIMQKYYYTKAVYEGKRAGASIYPT